MLVLDNMAIEARIYNSVKPLIPELLNVHVPLSEEDFMPTCNWIKQGLESARMRFLLQSHATRG